MQSSLEAKMETVSLTCLEYSWIRQFVMVERIHEDGTVSVCVVLGQLDSRRHHRHVGN